MGRNLENIIHYNIAFIGGFFGGYSVCNIYYLLGNAQTLNFISIVHDLFYCDFITLVFRIAGVLFYFGGLALSVIVPRYTKLNCRYLSMALDAICLIIMAIMPDDLNILVRLYPIFFAVSFQWTAFDKIEGYVSSTIFSTNNFRQFSTSIVEYICDKDKSRLRKTKLFGFTLLSFHAGVALACAGSIWIGSVCSLLGILPVIFATVLIINENKTDKTK